MPASSSSASPAPGFAVYLYDLAQPVPNRVALVDVPVLSPSAGAFQSLPNLVNYLGRQYVWSNNLNAYQLASQVTAQGDLGAPQLSVLSNPQQ
jgi:hypothetical protein